MTEQAEGRDTLPPESAGALLRAARQAQGLHIAALATTLKVAPRKLEALENDRYDELQGATFARALALAACRALKIDPSPVLERLPAQDGGNLSQLDGGLNAPFRERGARRESAELPGFSRAAMAVVLLLLLGALAFWLLPTGWHWPAASAPAPAASTSTTVTTPLPIEPSTSQPPVFVPAPAASVAPVSLASPPLAPAAPSVPAASAPLAPQPAASKPALLPAATASTTSAPAVAVAGTLQLRVRAASWVEVVDARQKVLLGRTLAAGEAVGVDGVLPLRVKIGNVLATELSFRGRPVDLATVTRDNVARLELK